MLRLVSSSNRFILNFEAFCFIQGTHWPINMETLLAALNAIFIYKIRLNTDIITTKKGTL